MFNKKIKTPFLIILLLLSGIVHAQSGLWKNASFGVQGHYGSFITSLTRSVYVKDSYTSLMELSYIRQTDGSKSWHKANGLPQWGMGLFFGNSGSRQHMGRIGGPFSFVDFQLIRRNWFRSAFRVGGGLGFVEKPYDPQDNHKNLLLGSSANVYLNFLWKNEIRLGPQWYINGGLSFSHLSNGKVSLPNLGLNVPAFTAGIRFAPDRATLVEQPVSDSFSKKINMQLLVSAGIKQEPTVGGKRYLVNVFSGEATRQFSGSGRYGAGVLVSIDRSWGDHSVDSIIPRRASVEKPFNASVFVSYEQLLGKFSIPVQLGVYVIEKYYGEALYQNFGLRYHMNRNWSTGIYLKTHFGHADYIHAGIGYRF